MALLDEEVEDQGKSVDGDWWPGHSEDAVEFGGEEADSVELGDLCEKGVLGGESSEPGGILSNESRDCSWAVGDIEMGSVIDIGGALGGVEVFMEVAGGWESAFLGGDPEVGGSGIEDDSEALRWGSDVDLSKS